MSNPHNLKVGQEVIIKRSREWGRGDKADTFSTHKITEIRRKYFKVEGMPWEEFLVKELLDKPAATGYKHKHKVYLSQKDIDDEIEHRNRCNDIKNLAEGVHKLSLEKLREIYTLLRDSITEATKK